MVMNEQKLATIRLIMVQLVKIITQNQKEVEHRVKSG
ncbi:hypothetical protein PAAL109150_24880 [Paenibacillus alkaliterrae]